MKIKKKNENIYLLFLKNKFSGPNFNINELIINEINNLPKCFWNEIEQSLKLKLIKNNYILLDNQIFNNQKCHYKYSIIIN